MAVTVVGGVTDMDTDTDMDMDMDMGRELATGIRLSRTCLT
jgi:hypothetical protein